MLTRQRVTSMYAAMDAACNAEAIREHSRTSGHGPIVAVNPRRNTALKAGAEAKRALRFKTAEDLRAMRTQPRNTQAAGSRMSLAGPHCEYAAMPMIAAP